MMSKDDCQKICQKIGRINNEIHDLAQYMSPTMDRESTHRFSKILTGLNNLKIYLSELITKKEIKIVEEE